MISKIMYPPNYQLRLKTRLVKHTVPEERHMLCSPKLDDTKLLCAPRKKIKDTGDPM